MEHYLELRPTIVRLNTVYWRFVTELLFSSLKSGLLSPTVTY
jgi:hypothetical protein